MTKSDSQGVKRWKKHVANLNRILKDDRISGSRRLLAQTLAMWMDAPDDKKHILELILVGTWGPTKRGQVKWVDEDEPAVPEPENTRLDLITKEQIKNVFDEVLGETNGGGTSVSSSEG